MKDRLYKNILLFIVVMIGLTIVTQGFYMVGNYKESKNRLRHDVQKSLDNAVEIYFAERAEKNLDRFLFSQSIDSVDKKHLNHPFFKFDTLPASRRRGMSIEIDLTDSVSEGVEIWKFDNDSEKDSILEIISMNNAQPDSLRFPQWFNKRDSSFVGDLTRLTSRIVFGLTQDGLDIKAFDTIVHQELKRRDIAIDYNLTFSRRNNNIVTTNRAIDSTAMLTAVARNDVLPRRSKLKMQYSNMAGTLFRKNALNLLLSFLFVTGIIACLLYLLKVIKGQKQLAEIKNDLISNITHEFKTPIATIGAAMEGIKVFNSNNDTEKTLKYAEISTQQVDKLNGMVEKLLETATLDSEHLELAFEETDIVKLLSIISKNELVAAPQKMITFTTNEASVNYAIDRFHFENAINNILDNAVKYGGDNITIHLVKQHNKLTITIADDGNQLTLAQSKQIFNKFYRVHTGNTHNVKGFGIGLYYTRAIIDKHQGTIDVTVQPTTFTINLPL